MIYFVVFILLLIPVVKYDWMAKTGGENKWYYFNLVVLILLAGLRYRVGSDTLMYMSMFDECPTLDELKYFDFEVAKYNPLWYILNAVSRTIYDDFVLFQIIHAIIVNSVFFVFFRKYCSNYYFTAILLYYIGYFCYFNMEVMRESLCVCVLLLSIHFMLDRKWIYYYMMCVIGLLFHYSAILLFVFPLLFLFRKPSWKLELLIFLVMIIVMKVINLPMLVLGLFGLNEQLIQLVESYIYEQRNLMGIISELLNYLPILGFIWIRESKTVEEKKDFTFIMMGTVVIYALSMSIGIFSRFINYFAPFIIVYSVNTLYQVLKLKFKYYQISYLVCIFSTIVLCFNMIRFYTKDVSDIYPGTRSYVRYIPYYSVLKPKIDEHRERFIENDREVSIDF